MEGHQMEFSPLFVYVFAGMGGLLVLLVFALFFVSYRAHKVTKSLLTIMTQPERAKIQDASRVLQKIMSGEMEKITACFTTIHNSLRDQIVQAENLQQELTARNDALVNLTEDAVKKTSQTAGRLENTVSGLQNIVESAEWNNIQNTTDGFLNGVSQVLENINAATSDSTTKLSQIEESMNKWNMDSKVLQEELEKSFNTNMEQFQNLSTESDNMKTQISTLAETTANTFSNVKNAAKDYEDIMENNTKILTSYLIKLKDFSNTSKKQLTGQMNTLSNTANVVGTQVLLAEASLDGIIKKMADGISDLMKSSEETKKSIINVSAELTTLTNHFNKEIKEYSNNVISNFKTVSGVANATLNNTKEATTEFSNSVNDMNTTIRENLLEINKANNNLSTQSQNLIEMSEKTTEQLKPLSELIKEYSVVLPELTSSSTDATKNMTQIVAQLGERIEEIKSVVAKSEKSVTESSEKLNDLAEHSRQQMIDLMSDYKKAVETLQTLNNQMAVARAAAPMDAIKNVPTPYARVSSRDFLTQNEQSFNKMYEQAMDLIRAMGAEIPDLVWKKYHDGDKTIFAKWLSKMLKATDKKRIRDLIKNDTVFRSQATQFVHGFDYVLNAAKQTDTPDKLIVALNKTDLGMIYSSLVSHI